MVGYLWLFFKPDMALGLGEEDRSDVALYQDEFDPSKNPHYAPGGKYDYARYGIRCWVLDPLLFRRMVRVSHDIKTNALGAFYALKPIIRTFICCNTYVRPQTIVYRPPFRPCFDADVMCR